MPRRCSSPSIDLCHGFFRCTDISEARASDLRHRDSEPLARVQNRGELVLVEACHSTGPTDQNRRELGAQWETASRRTTQWPALNSPPFLQTLRHRIAEFSLLPAPLSPPSGHSDLATWLIPPKAISTESWTWEGL